MSTLSLLQYTKEQRLQVFANANTTLEETEKKVKYIREWMEAQPYFSEPLENEMIERFLLTQAFDVERTKTKFIGYYIVRTVLPDYFQQNPNSPKILKAKKSFVYVVLPTLTKDLGRIVVNSFNKDCENEFDPASYFAYVISVLEVRVRHDWCYREFHILDMKNFKIGHLAKFTPSVFKHLSLLKKKLNDKTKVEMHFINVPSYIESFVNTIKSLLNPKIHQRIMIHKDLESLHTVIPKENCPKEYGGTAESVIELEELWKKQLLEYDSLFERLKNVYIKMDLLPENIEIDNDFGVHGCFRKLEID